MKLTPLGVTASISSEVTIARELHRGLPVSRAEHT